MESRTQEEIAAAKEREARRIEGTKHRAEPPLAERRRIEAKRKTITRARRKAARKARKANR